MSIQEMLALALAEEARNLETYLVFAAQAEAEGFPQVARLFRATAESERIHARAELELLGTVRSTAENLQWSVATEEAEFQDHYARFLREAQRDGREDICRLLGHILAVERGHHKLFREAMAALLDGGNPAPAPVFVCRQCGNTVVGRPTAPCPICGAGPEAFEEVA